MNGRENTIVGKTNAPPFPAPVVVIFFPGTWPAQPNAGSAALLARFVFECTGGVVLTGTMLPPGPDMMVRLLSPTPPHGALPTTGILIIVPRFDVILPVNP